MSGNRIPKIASKPPIVIVLFFLTIGISYAVDDGFCPARKIEGKYFTVYYNPPLDIFSLNQQLNIHFSEQIMAGEPMKKDNSPEAELTGMLDTLFMRVCDILDMHLYSFQGKIKICQDSKQLNKIYNNLFNKEPNIKSFYVYSFNTIYISKDDFKREILGHEIAHAIISHYFVVQAPVKIQEVLAMYVEYQLRRVGK